MEPVSANQNHFNSPNVSQKHDEQPLHVEMARRIGKALLKAYYPFNDEQTTVLDFACGTGNSSCYSMREDVCLNSRVLASHVKTIIGADISQEMVDRYNKRVANQGISEEEMRAVCIPGELLDDTSVDQEEHNLQLKKLLGGVEFDVAICCMSYHHFPSISSATRTLSSLLKPGGYLYVADVESIPAQSSAHESNNTQQSDINLEPIFSEGVCEAGVVMHKYGFSRDEIKGTFLEAGLAEINEETGQVARFGYDIVTRAFKNGKAVNIFLATGVKPFL
ncbi:S-adenosyl-L-methionine-dependent methyltransferase [Lentinula boryana]|uniref:S-adenosyl-L-methionine-dependent methyltransferase n=1 Tax=Lentinula boryana TaxID=40481 RepID=A0ABQ8QP55_9AGAR|nr:S-adenosyl-L-methionine-dependent methyltransferase [Lentinula boryana]